MKKLFSLAGLFFLALSVFAQVERSAGTNVIDVYTDASNPRPNSASYAMPYAYGQNRYLLFIFTGEFNTDQDYPTAITYNGVSATLLVQSVGSTAEGTTSKTAVSIFGIKDVDLGAATQANTTYPINVTWAFGGPVKNNQSYVLTAIPYRYVSQSNSLNFCIQGSIGNDATTLTCSPVTANAGDLIFHAAQFANAQGVTLSATSPITTNNFMAQIFNSLFPTGNAVNKAYIATTWDANPNASTTYTPTFTNTSNTNPQRWVVMGMTFPYQPVFQTISGKVWIDPNGNKTQDVGETPPPSNFYWVIAVATNGPDAGKVKAVSPLDVDGGYSLTVKANQVTIAPSVMADPTFEIDIVTSAPPIGNTYSLPSQGALGAAPIASGTSYYVTNPLSLGGYFSNIGRYNVTATAPYTTQLNVSAGVQSPAATDAVFTTLPMRPVGTFWNLDNSDQLLSGSDYELPGAPGLIETGGTFRILSNPTAQAGLSVKLAYDANGNGPDAGDIIDASANPSDNIYYDITNYDPAKMYVYFESGQGNYNGQFTYGALDAANATVPATYSFSAILPVSGLDLSGAYNNAKANLRWKTLSTDNVDHFIIERGNKASGFTQVGLIAVNGKEYNFTDDLGAYSGNDVYYRIKLVNKNGSISISNVISLKIDGIRGLQLLPTLVRNDLQIRFTNPKTQDINVRVVNIAGQVVVNYRTNVSAGNASINLNGFDKLSNGTYNVQIFTGSSVQQGKIVVQH